MLLLFLLCTAFLRLSDVEIKRADYFNAKQEAESNARMALMMALGQLQELAGGDRVTTANANILADEKTLANPYYVGVWRTSYQAEEGGLEWPLVGKRTLAANEMYAHQGAYSDLRHTHAELNENKWKQELHLGWLVSSPLESADPFTKHELSDPSVVEMLGKGTLGNIVSDNEYLTESVRVRKISLAKKGAIAWWTSENNQKATIKPKKPNEAELALSTSTGSNLTNLSLNSTQPFLDSRSKLLVHGDKLVTTASAHLADVSATEAYKYFSHDLTNYSSGLYTDVVFGGIQHDMTPLLFARSDDTSITFVPPNERISDRLFSSEYPLISCEYHDVLAPTFDALRYWGLQKYLSEGTLDLDVAEHAIKQRSGDNWPHGLSDGMTVDPKYWSAKRPKTHPIMTDTRWHYYFSIADKNIRTHIIPRVCLWNPYNREIKINEMVVMMPNPFYKASGGFHFYVEEDEVLRLKEEIENPRDSVHSWVRNGASPLEDQYKARLSNSDLFPQTRYLTFVLEGMTMDAGECHVFSPSPGVTDISESGVRLAKYDADRISNNILRSDANQGGDHFYFDVSNTKFQIQTASSWRNMSSAVHNHLQLGKIHDYRPESGRISESFPFILKASNGDIPHNDELLQSGNHPTIQLVNNGTGGVAPTYYFAYIGSSWGSANTVGSFGPLQNFHEAPYKDAPATHQVGAKLIWLDEARTEGNRAPLRYGTSTKTRWTSEHMVYHPATIANWNVRAHLTSRSPIAQCAEKWYLFSTGPWILQFVPKSPQDANDAPLLNATGSAYVKNPFGTSVQFAHSPNVVLFDLPHREYGVHSIASMRHAMLSPYSWHPSYILGHSLRDPHAPASSTVHPEVISFVDHSGENHWDHSIGGYRSSYNYGAANAVNDSNSLLQLGNEAISRSVDRVTLTSQNDILPYDIAFEVNQSLWDSYFLSTLPLDENTNSFASITPDSQRCVIQPASDISESDLTKILTEGENSINHGFWLNGYCYKKSDAFNVNSTSVPAWTAFLSSTLHVPRGLKSGSISDAEKITFVRNLYPIIDADFEHLDPEESDAWTGMRSLTSDECVRLATAIVDEVKLRGPFISLADFVNRRLTDQADATSQMGTLDAAIYKSGLNQGFYDNPAYSTSTVDRGTDPASEDNNQSFFRQSYLYDHNGETVTSQAPIKSWGLPSFLMQSDILDALAPWMTTRGDTFTIRAYGESSRNGKILATAYIEAVVERSPHYVQHQDIRDSNRDPQKNIPTDSHLKKDPLTGEITLGNLTILNSKLGRRYKIKSFRWLNEDEI